MESVEKLLAQCLDSLESDLSLLKNKGNFFYNIASF